MPPDWTPSERVYVWAEARGLTRADVLDELDEFRIYWADAGTARASWDATFINRLKQIRTRRTDPTPTRAPSTSEDVPHATQPELRFRNTIERFHWIEAELCRERAQADHERDLRGIVHEYDRQHGGFQPVGATLGRLFSGA
jgi:hypothetical protein